MDFLPFECLQVIFTMLCVVDMIQLAKTNRAMNDVFKRVVSSCVKPHESLVPKKFYVNSLNVSTLSTFFDLPDFAFDRLIIDINVMSIPNLSSVMELIGKLDVRKKSRLFVQDNVDSVSFTPYIKHLVGINKLKINGNTTNVHDDLVQQQLSTIPSLIFIQVNNLNLTRFTSLESFSLIESNISDAYELRNIRTLSLSKCKNITDVSMLGNVYDLDLSYTNVSDVSMLGNVYALNLTHTRVIDVSKLGRVHKLNLSNTKVEDVSMLGDVYDLNLTDCNSVGVLDSLVRVHKLNLSGVCIHTVGMFCNVHNLTLSKCNRITDLHTLKSVHTLNVSFTFINDVSMLGDNFVLDLSNTKVEDVSMLGRVHTLNLYGTPVKDVSKLGNVHTLNLARTKVEDVSMLGRVHTLNLTDTRVQSVVGLENVHTLNLTRTKVEDVSMLGRVHTLILYDTRVRSVVGLENVHTLDLTRTPIKAEMLRSLTGVTWLKHTEFSR